MRIRNQRRNAQSGAGTTRAGNTTHTLVGLLVVAAITVAFLPKACSTISDAGERGARLFRTELKLRYDFSPGWLVSHDLNMVNTSGKTLNDVRLKVQFVGEGASPTVTRYWARWELGEEQTVSVPVDQVSNVQRVVVSGSADEGVFDAEIRGR